MVNVRQLFSKEDVIRYFMEEDFIAIPRNKIMNIVLDIRQHELDILESWEGHFQTLEVPHAVTKTFYREHGRKYPVWRLWKERVA